MANQSFTTKNRTPFAILSMLGGGLLMMILVISFNKDVSEKEEKTAKTKRAIEVKKQKKQVSAKPKPKPKPKKKTPKAPPPNLSSLMSGVSMNIPEFTTDDFADDTKDILGDIAQDAIMSEGTVDSKPKVVSRSAMEFPAKAAKEGITGYVIINLLVAKDGSVEIAKIIESQPAGVFDNSALSGVRTWRFTPAKYKGKAVKVWAKQKISFN